MSGVVQANQDGTVPSAGLRSAVWVQPHVRLVLALAGVLWGAGALARFAFGWWFAPAAAGGVDWWAALWLGARFDARVAVVTMALAWGLMLLPWLGARLRPPRSRAFWRVYWLLAALVWAAGVVFDAGHYAYLGQRLSSVLFSLARDTQEATGMVWQSYPVMWIVLAVLLWLGVSAVVFDGLWRWVTGGAVGSAGAERGTVSKPPRPWRSRGVEAVLVVLAVGVVHGRLSQYPLRWSDAVELHGTFSQSLALNPLQSLFDSWNFRDHRLDEAQMRPDADRIRAFVGLPPLGPGEPVSFLRQVPARPGVPGAPPQNVVLVLLESFAAHKTGSLGNPLGATPSFDALARDGLLYTRMMSAHAHTARGVFATVTGMPDVSNPSTASRNPAASNQHTIVNEFKAHQKFYFIGGSTSWANVRGVLTANIDGIEIYEEGRLRSPVVDVWGVSDKNLFFEAHERFKAQTQPFFAIIQTSGNHRPYTIPDEDLAQGFAPPTPSEAELKAQGFISLAEFRAFAYLDWCVGQFMQRASQAPYFKNTVFAFVGDHGIIGATGPHLPPAWQELAITQGHTPFLIYAPGRVAPRRVEHWAQQVDVMPTLASLVGIAYRNTTLGRDLLDPRFDTSRVAFETQFTGPGEHGVLVGPHLLVARSTAGVFDVRSKTPSHNLLTQTPVSPDVEQLQRDWGAFPQAYRNAALYLQTHNLRFRD